MFVLTCYPLFFWVWYSLSASEMETEEIQPVLLSSTAVQYEVFKIENPLRWPFLWCILILFYVVLF